MSAEPTNFEKQARLQDFIWNLRNVHLVRIQRKDGDEVKSISTLNLNTVEKAALEYQFFTNKSHLAVNLIWFTVDSIKWELFGCTSNECTLVSEEFSSSVTCRSSFDFTGRLECKWVRGINTLDITLIDSKDFKLDHLPITLKEGRDVHEIVFPEQSSVEGETSSE